ncbi:hypothetical protein [Pseudobythopirellula maris]|uniref:hypothetical protein n=1 Tax=Pseudobythopirellula maris TaxID=2527991 RepID=UPI0011B76543|nr:hypothetical protein [Pseudobythopirellula maris]
MLVVLAALAFPTVILAQGPGRGGPLGRGMGRGVGHDASMAVDRAGFHFLLRNNGSIERSVTELPNGVRTRTTSQDAEVAAQIRAHVAAMYGRMKEGRPVRRWDPLFAALFEKSDQVALAITEVPGGVEVVETSTEPEAIALIQAHAKVVSGFVERGFAEARLAHPVPGAIPAKSAKQHPTTTDQSLQRLRQLSAEFDRVYIPALALTNQGRRSPSLEALRRLNERLVAMRRQARDTKSDDQELLFKGTADVVAEAARLAQSGDFLEAHETLEPLRDQLASRRRSLGVDYRLDVLSDYHAVMEAIVKPANGADPNLLDAAALDRLRQQAASAAAIWARVEQTKFDTSYAPLSDAQKQNVEPLVQANREAISRLNRALREGDATEVLGAAVAIKPPFAKLYMSFGDFSGLAENASSTPATQKNYPPISTEEE